MNIESFRELCLALPHTTEDIKWEHHLCFCVGEKMYCITGLDENPVTASFKADEEDFEILTRREGFKPAPYLARYKWVWTRDIGLLSNKEWSYYLSKAHTLTYNKLPKKTRIQLEP